MHLRNLIVVVGPTAVGKTALAMRLAEHYQTEIVSADSRQIYKELEIGTAKPSREELSRVKHHFVGIKSIEDEYDAGQYGLEAREVIDRLFTDHEVVILCGGSGLYVKAVLEGFDDLPEIPAEIRTDVIRDYKEKGLAWLRDQVAENDPDYFEVVDRKNPQRLMRALEVFRATGSTFSGFHKKEKIVLPFGVVKIGLELDREELYNRIDERMDEMIQHGLLAEAERFFTLRHLNALQTVGYQEVFGFLEGTYDQDEAVRLMKRNTRHYAKRQFTWFKRDLEIHWFKPDEWNLIIEWLNKKIGK